MAALPQPDVTPERSAPPLRLLPAPDTPLPAPGGAPSRLQALALLLVLPLALIATVVVILPARPTGRPEIMVVGSVAGTRWAHDELSALGPLVLSADRAGEPTPAVTEIRYQGPSARAQAQAVRRSLGTGRLIEAPLLEQRFPVIVYLGKDAPDP